MKLSSALKKEFMYFSRTFRMFGVIFSIMIFALADPVMIKGLGWMMNSLVETVEETAAGEEVFTEDDAAALSSFSDMDASGMMAMSIGDFTSTAVLIVLLIMMGPSGSEQKKRSIIIPRCAGLTPNMYVTPKFILYPLTGFLSGLLGMFSCAGVTSLLFEGAIDMGMLALAAVSVGLYIAFVMILELTLGICTERPGVSVITVLAATTVIPTLLSSFRIDKFNPFALPSIAQNAFLTDATVMGVSGNAELDMTNVAVSLLVTVILSLILYFTTLFVLTARQIENEGNEAIL
ncbi:MAG: hypothetical protein J6A41_03665 [Ruminiclostridium sp.]|nr:hypothetical protein [Ruminiclostridium sp.]